MIRVVDARAYPIPVLMRTLDIVELLSQSSEALKFTAICGRTGIPRTTAYRILKTLYQRGYVHHLADGSYKFNTKVSTKWHGSKSKPMSDKPDSLTAAISSGAIERSIELLMGVLSEAQGNQSAPTPPVQCKQCAASRNNGSRVLNPSSARRASKPALRRAAKFQAIHDANPLQEQYSA